MLPAISFRGNVQEEARRLDLEIREIPFVTAKALTRTGQAVRKGLQEEMPRVFDKPTPFTINSLFLKPATKQSLSAIVWFKELNILREEHYLEPQVYGGGRPLKPFEQRLRRAGILPPGMFAVPGAGARLNQYGNMSAGQIVQILSQLRTFTEAGFDAHPSGSTRSRRNIARAGTFFAVRPGHPTLPPGVFQRRGRNRGIVPVLVFVKAPGYSALFKFFEIAERIAVKEFPSQFAIAAAESRKAALMR